ncbi:cold shock domain-containing protein [Streptomyces sp. bgisy100]|uniref:cold shock domain-containing protein n=1 Tax=Streptomyces sp. bgisy100 TaxID=3413783 RepID=UPI003D722EB5
MKWFDNAGQFGAIVPDGCEAEVAVQYCVVAQRGGDRLLKAGDRVVFDITLDADGRRADNIRLLDG